MDASITHDVTVDNCPLRPQCPEPIKLPLVSFVLRNWNYAEYVGSAIDSIRNQDYPRFEAIIVDNGSTDASRDVIARHVDGDPRCRVIHLEDNLGPLGGALRGLDAASGQFVTFVDSDDYLLPGFASHHIQVHLSVERNVAFSSSNAIEILGDGTIVSGRGRGFSPPRRAKSRGLRAAHSVPRLGTVSDEAFARLSAATINLAAKDKGWLWAFGSSSMYRRFLLDYLKPLASPERLQKLSADGHYSRLCHVFGSSVLIDIPLSTYRIHDRNHFSQTTGVGTASSHLGIRRHEALRVLLDQPEDKLWRIQTRQRYWSAFENLMTADGVSAATTADDPEFQDMIAEYLPGLVGALGARETIFKLRSWMQVKQLNHIVHRAYPNGTPPDVRRHLALVNAFRGSLKRFVRVTV